MRRTRVGGIIDSPTVGLSSPLLFGPALGPNTPRDQTNTNNDSDGSDPNPRPVTRHEALRCESDVEPLQYPDRSSEDQDHTRSDSQHPSILVPRETGGAAEGILGSFAADQPGDIPVVAAIRAVSPPPSSCWVSGLDRRRRATANTTNHTSQAYTEMRSMMPAPGVARPASIAPA